MNLSLTLMLHGVIGICLLHVAVYVIKKLYRNYVYGGNYVIMYRTSTELNTKYKLRILVYFRVLKRKVYRLSVCQIVYLRRLRLEVSK